MKIDRRKFLLGSTVFGIGVTGVGVYSNSLNATNSKTKLPIPKLLDTKVLEKININIINATHEFFPGIKSNTKGFDASYLGPTIRLYKGGESELRFTNHLNEKTTIHGHGLHVDGKWDGGPQNVIQAKESLTYKYNIIQQASTNWYHPHLMGKTAEQVHAGLAGFILIEDENSLSLGLPNTYGVDDIPLAIQDRTFLNGVMTPYKVTMEQIMDGLKEETFIVNGAIAPFQYVPAGWIRLRLLNGSNARYQRFSLSNGDSFVKIATEGGFLSKPIALSSLEMGPGERNEILINMAETDINTMLVESVEGDGNIFTQLFNEPQIALELRVDSSKVAINSIPKILNNIEHYDPYDVAITRNFELQMGGDGGNEGENMSSNPHAMFSINGNPMDMKVINHTGKTNQLELWRIRSEEMRHPFHMHGTSFLILSQNGKPPKIEDRGWKDTVDINEGVVEVLLKFNVISTKEYPFMYHCHILEHEDAGMMGQFTVSK